MTARAPVAGGAVQTVLQRRSTTADSATTAVLLPARRSRAQRQLTAQRSTFPPARAADRQQRAITRLQDRARRLKCPALLGTPLFGSRFHLLLHRRFSNALGASNSSRFGPCAAGRWGGLAQTTNQCNGTCSGGYWCGQASTSPRQNPCPAHSNSTSGGIALTSCLCLPGYAGANGGPCNICPPGTFTHVRGNLTCGNCQAGFYGGRSGMTVSTCSG